MLTDHDRAAMREAQAPVERAGAAVAAVRRRGGSHAEMAAALAAHDAARASCSLLVDAILADARTRAAPVLETAEGRRAAVRGAGSRLPLPL